MNAKIRRLAQTITGQQTHDGAGVKLMRIITPGHYDGCDPFLLLDEFASDEAADYIGGFPDHPHRGFETVTYLLQGAMRHQDHLGNTGHMRAGDVQWMNAGRGVIHSEMPEQVDGKLHGFQLWINLPASEKLKPPRYRDYAAEMPELTLADGCTAKIIAGQLTSGDGNTRSGAVTGIAVQPVLADVLLAPAQGCAIPLPADDTVLVYVYQGEAVVDGDGRQLSAGQLGRLADGEQIVLRAEAQPARLLLLAARPLAEPMAHGGPFIMNSQAEIEQAFRDYRDGVLVQA